MNNILDDASGLRNRVIKIMEKEPKSYDDYAKEIGISLHTFFYFIKGKKVPSRITKMKIELFLKKKEVHEKNK